MAEAKFFLSAVKKVSLSYPLVLDLEVNQRNVSKSVLTDVAVAFLREIEKAGYFAMIYSSKLGRDADIWQYSDCGKVAGIYGNVDMNICYREDLRCQVGVKVEKNRNLAENHGIQEQLTQSKKGTRFRKSYRNTTRPLKLSRI
ncbi:GH25 family lysozyme [Bacillus swezeyi]|uniref:GH25 family lysozyme n=1 Tax=Bacillus swezeyi TaxID=1925020 RepID=UPI001CC26DB5|nr:GH25 family lysozyme [Bacillus swezeyi]